ncbi:glycosyltransferase [Zobellia galactanivorans]|uniref:glycosyltransferase n=1 Tax=Zobellia galactanivorans (strain DSM 12802 / CCUG 47099 / CIP 106680 / NCIMB 13871 / Dsij) TaxID=63186 RepID=UPI0026E31909|nr:glycosyltransferase [Zobellia galactanivorans]MDO6809174.1 glycosyltransferase [Zobellia galactanivorans]
MNILHVTTVHPRKDTRIFYRECQSLQKAGFDVTLLVSDGMGDEIDGQIKIVDLGRDRSRIRNFRKSYRKIVSTVRRLKPKLVHFHDPELIFVGSRISKMGIPVVFDIHENVAAQILNKPYIYSFLRKPISELYKIVENCFVRNLHMIIAEHSYRNVYEKRGLSLTTVLNMPELNHFRSFVNTNRMGADIFYIGGVSDERGLHVTISALKILKKRGFDFFMHYIGPITDDRISSLDLEDINKNIRFYGRMDSKNGFEISKRCIAGLSVLKPIKNYIESYSTKIFEYMAVGLPVITSNFQLYRDVVEKYNCGFCINPYSSEELADSLEALISNPKLVRTMGENGIDAVKSRYNWSSEESKLIDVYYKALNLKKSS